MEPGKALFLIPQQALKSGLAAPFLYNLLNLDQDFGEK